MPTVALQYPTINQIAGSLTNGAPEFAKILQTICPAGDIFGEFPVVTCNQGTVHHISRVKTLGASAVARAINQGVPNNMAENEPATEVTMSLQTKYPIDAELLEKAGTNKAAFIQAENKKAMLRLRMDANEWIMYGNRAAPGGGAGIDGIATRYNALEKIININTGRDQVWDYGGTGANLTSIYLIAPGVDSVSLIAPAMEGRQAGLRVDNFGPQNGVFPADRDGNTFQGHLTWYKWNFGLCVHNPHAIMRLANIPSDTLQTLVNNGATLPADHKLVRTMIEMTSYVSEDVDRDSWRFLMSREMFASMKILMFEKSNAYWVPSDLEGRKFGRIVGDFLGTPCFASDYILGTEEQIVAA